MTYKARITFFQETCKTMGIEYTGAMCKSLRDADIMEKLLYTGVLQDEF